MSATSSPTCTPDLLLGRLLSVLRQMQGISQVQVGDALGVDGKTVAAWEGGRSGITLGMLDEIGATLGVPGVLLHVLHAQATVDLQRAGCRVTRTSWRRSRGRGAKPSESQPEAPSLSKKRLDVWLQEWSVESQFSLLDIHLGVPWVPLRVQQRMLRADRAGSDQPEVHIVNLEVGMAEPLPWFVEQMEPTDEDPSHA